MKGSTIHRSGDCAFYNGSQLQASLGCDLAPDIFVSAIERLARRDDDIEMI
jgi:hypothetical protein